MIGSMALVFAAGISSGPAFADIKPVKRTKPLQEPAAAPQPKDPYAADIYDARLIALGRLSS